MTNAQYFEPTPAMRLYAFHKAKAGKKAKNTKLSKLVGVRPETISRWFNINFFSEWLELEIALYRAPIEALLEQKAIEMISKGDFRFWEAMHKKYSTESQPDGFEFIEKI